MISRPVRILSDHFKSGAWHAGDRNGFRLAEANFGRIETDFERKIGRILTKRLARQDGLVQPSRPERLKCVRVPLQTERSE